MEMILNAVMKKCSALLVDAAFEEANVVLGVKGEVQKLLLKMKNIQFLLKDAEKRKFNDPSINLWLSLLKDVMYDADDIIDLCMIKDNQLLADDENSKNDIFRVCCNISSAFSSCFTNVPLHHGIGTRIKDLNVRLQQIDENRKQFNLQRSEIVESPRIPLFNPRQAGPLADPLVVGEEVDVAANELVNLLITGEVVEERRCRIFAVAGMGGIGKTTLAQKIFNHQRMENYFSLKVWVTVSQTYSEIELLKQVIRGAKGSCGDANTKEELLLILRDSVASGQILFLVLDDVWSAGVWVDLLRVPLQTANASVRVLVTTRYEDVAKAMNAAYTHNVMKLSIESSWDMLRKLLFSDGGEQPSDELKKLGIDMVKRCGGLPLAIKAIAGVLVTRERTKKEWDDILRSDIWSIKDLHEDHIAALQLSFEDLPSHLKQCFLYFSLYGEDEDLYRDDIARLWVAEGFISQENINEGSLMEDVAEQYFNELLGRNLLEREDEGSCKMHDLVRSLVIFLSKEETSYGDVNVRNSTTFTKLRRLSIEHIKGAEATEIFDLVPKQGALRTLLASFSDLVLNEERLKWLSCLRVLDISYTPTKELPDSIGDLVHLRYLNLSFTGIMAIPESIERLSYLQFLDISFCYKLTKLPNGIIQLHNLRYFHMTYTSITFMPKGIEKLQKLNFLTGFSPDNNDTSSKLKDLNSLKQLRTLEIYILEGAQCEEITLRTLPHLSYLTLGFSLVFNDQAELFDKLIPPQSLEKLCIKKFFGRRFPSWMASTCFENYVPNLTTLHLNTISCAALPSLGQLPKLRTLIIESATKVKKIGLEFLGGGVNSIVGIAIAFPKLESLYMYSMYELEEWSLGAQVEVNAFPRLKILPCLHEVRIWYCPLLKQLPKGLKNLPIKSLSIKHIDSLESLDDLPSELEELNLFGIKHLEGVLCLSMLKNLSIEDCGALPCLTNVNSLQKLVFRDFNMERLPDWLLKFLRQQGLKNKEDFLLDLNCPETVFQGCLKGGSYWELIKQIPRVIVRSLRRYLRYNKHPYVYDAKSSDEDDEDY